MPSMAPSGHPRLGRLTGRSHSLPHCTDLTLQNILKRTAQGSEDEDMATKAFNALKEVSLAGQGVSGSQGPPPTLWVPLREPQPSESLVPQWEPEAGLWEPGLGRLHVTHPWPPQLVQECNASVQSMKRTEELIHLSKKIHFEGKVHALSWWDGAALSPPSLGAAGPHHCPRPPIPCPRISALQPPA